MSSAEVLSRSRQLFRDRAERRAWRRGASNSALTTADAGVHLAETASRLVPGSQRKELERLRKEFPDTYAELASQAKARAEAVLSGEWDLLGHPVDLRGRVEWHQDPRSNHRYPKTFFGDVALDFESDDSIDVKYVWEIGRHQFLVELAQGWLLTGEERYADRVREVILDWIEENPRYVGVHWTSGLELAMRAISWIWSIAMLADWKGWQSEDWERLAESLAEHADYLEHHLSLFSSPYNHLIGEGTGLYLIGCVLPGCSRAESFKSRGRAILSKHTARQFHTDGFTVEQATGYHYYTLGFLSLAIAAAREQDAPMEGVEGVARRSFQTGAAFCQPDGLWPAIGDVDSARSIPILSDNFWDFRSLSALGATLFSDQDMKLDQHASIGETYWLLGAEGVRQLEQLEPRGDVQAVVLSDSGYAAARCGNDAIVFDAGPIADGLFPDATPSTAHGHLDALQVTYCMDGKPVLIDPGMPFYFGDNDWVRHFRSASAHNSIEIEGLPLAEVAGRLAWSHVAERPVLDAKISDEVWLARGRVKLSAGAAVERFLCGLPGHGLWIADRIRTADPRQIHWYWQLPENSLGQRNSHEAGCTVLSGDDLTFAVWSDGAAPKVGVDKSHSDSPVAWNAPGYGKLRAAQRVHCESNVAESVLCVTFVGKNPIPVDVRLDDHHMLCRMADTSCDSAEKNRAEPIPEAEITWRFLTEGGVIEYSAGTDIDELPQSVTRLDGTGDWPGCVIRHQNHTPAASSEQSRTSMIETSAKT